RGAHAAQRRRGSGRRFEAPREGATVDRAAASAAQQTTPTGIKGTREKGQGKRAKAEGLPLSLSRRARYQVPLPNHAALVLGERTLVMGVINVTPDSFSDGGIRFDATRAVEDG